MRAPSIILVGLGAAILSACASDQGLTPKAALTDANQLAAHDTLAPAVKTTAPWPGADWWRAFGDPQLDRLMDEALAGSPDLR
ncbi:MAG TPA: fusaric acid resistance protein, partial [Candidatus Competibacteraceae bacterium]|nr:fusaric acid resistance protein [Candidatus Competibacteraceae bacterium]